MTQPAISSLPPTSMLIARLTPSQEQMILHLNMARWHDEPGTILPQDQGLLVSLRKLGIIAATSATLTHQGVLVAGALTLQRLRQDP